jgi:hypothetical protein
MKKHTRAAMPVIVDWKTRVYEKISGKNKNMYYILY